MTTLLEGNELRRAVAEAHGYSIEYHKNSRNYIVILDPNKQKVYGPTNAEFTHLVFKWATDESAIPDYATDLNTIKDAPLDEDVTVKICWEYDSIPRWDVTMTTETRERYNDAHPEPATAFWNAWLMMRKAARNG